MSSDLVIVGGGILGLWAAKYAADAGLSVILVDYKLCGRGGSNGVLGALAPHLPDSNNEKKQFQWRALDELPALIGKLEVATGLVTGYGQTGRLMPIRVEGFANRMQRCVAGASEHWQMKQRQYRFEQVDVQGFEDWINPAMAPMGLAYDTLSARAAPRLLTAALKASLEGTVEIIEDFVYGQFLEEAGLVMSRCGTRSIKTDRVILAAGYETYGLVKELTRQDLGHGIKGHSALFRLPGVADLPALYDNGVYVVPHGDGTVAVGSNSQKDWHSADEVDEDQCSGFIERARELCPRLKNAQLLERWAGVRPRSFAKEPIVGALGDSERVHVLTGGFKISFGIAHRLAQALVERLTWAEQQISLPASYEVAYHLADARKDGRGVWGSNR
ncbi:MAG: FAD-binding oxidoreductase [bacterium]|nr:FAD-binding oxidoreductase [bacterium]